MNTKNKLLPPLVKLKDCVIVWYTKQRIRELESSRARWKSKAIQRRDRIRELEARLDWTEKELKKNDF